MMNRIQNVSIRYGRLSPAEAEVWVTVYPERLTSDTQATGRLIGPRCPYATTVEVAYPLREQGREYESTGGPRLSMRAIIPEANLWDPISPFLYQCWLDLWQGRQCCDRVEVTYGLRVLNLGPRGLRLNGHLLALRGVLVSECSEAEARALHQAGYNTLLVPAGADAVLWDLADRFGFLVLVRIADRAQLKAEVQRAEAFRKHVCCLGWVVAPEAVDQELAGIVAQTLPDRFRGQLLGMELKQPPAGPLPEKVSFVLCEEHLRDHLPTHWPKLVLRKRGAEELVGEAALPPGILGWIEA